MNRRANPISQCPLSACPLPTFPLFLAALWSATGYEWFPLLIAARGEELHLWALSGKRDTRSSWLWEQRPSSIGAHISRQRCTSSGTLPWFGLAQHLTHTLKSTWGFPLSSANSGQARASHLPAQKTFSKENKLSEQ